jgi:TonB family protein
MLARAHRPAFSWDRSAVLIGVIGLHVAGIYLVSVYGGFRQVVAKAAQALEVIPLPSNEQPAPEPPKEPVRLQQASTFVPEAPWPLIEDGDLPPVGESITVRVEHGGGGDSGARETVRLPTIPATPLAYRSHRSTDDYYPPISIRMGEEGAAIVRVCVAANGTLQDAPRVTEGSGFPRLDAAAVAWAREALTFTPATEGGAAVASCKGFRVRFTLRQ